MFIGKSETHIFIPLLVNFGVLQTYLRLASASHAEQNKAALERTFVLRGRKCCLESFANLPLPCEYRAKMLRHFKVLVVMGNCSFAGLSKFIRKDRLHNMSTI